MVKTPRHGRLRVRPDGGNTITRVCGGEVTYVEAPAPAMFSGRPYSCYCKQTPMMHAYVTHTGMGCAFLLLILLPQLLLLPLQLLLLPLLMLLHYRTTASHNL